MKKTNRLIDFFAVIGPDSQFTINDPDIDKGRVIFCFSLTFFFFSQRKASQVWKLSMVISIIKSKQTKTILKNGLI